MRKFIFTASVTALIALVPVVLVGYLHTDGTLDNGKPATEIASDVTNGQDDGSTFHLVKAF
jgi:hypothetical protein